MVSLRSLGILDLVEVLAILLLNYSLRIQGVAIPRSRSTGLYQTLRKGIVGKFVLQTLDVGGIGRFGGHGDSFLQRINGRQLYQQLGSPSEPMQRHFGDRPVSLATTNQKKTC